MPRVSVTWGGFSIVKAELNLIRTANSYGQFGHFHLLSGEDLPVKSNKEIDLFFQNINKLIFWKLVHV
ncbi:beta-1,6-N-acetylglucosaminyltransferase [Pediococcus ethanolidurans]|nr:beta-1,6-N-acetylglucosaminyltransferase [Pediococcus ethanolidurans]